MRVIAKKLGFFNGHLVQPGTEFTIESEQQLGSWMERVAAPIPEIEVTNDPEPNRTDDDSNSTDDSLATVPEDELAEDDADELEGLNQKQLRAKCQELGIAGYANLKNDEMHEAIRAKTSEA